MSADRFNRREDENRRRVTRAQRCVRILFARETGEAGIRVGTPLQGW